MTFFVIFLYIFILAHTTNFKTTETESHNMEKILLLKITLRTNIVLTKDPQMDCTGFFNFDAEALIQRIPLLDSNQETENRDPNRPILTLLNVLTAPPSSLLKRIEMLLLRLDNLSHMLLWSADTMHLP